MKIILNFIFSLFIIANLVARADINPVLASECGENSNVSNKLSCPINCPEIFVRDPISRTGYWTCKGVENIENTITNPALDPIVGAGEGETIIAKLLAAIINLFFIAGSVAVLVFFLIGGLAWITSEGDKGKMEIAKNRLTFAAVGIVIIAATYAILQILGAFLGISFFKGLVIIWPTLTGP